MSKLKKNNSHPLYKYHPVRFAAVRETYITEAMNILSRDCNNGAYPIFELPAQTRQQIDTYFCINTGCLRITFTSVKNKLGKDTINCIDSYNSPRIIRKILNMYLLFLPLCPLCQSGSL